MIISLVTFIISVVFGLKNRLLVPFIYVIWITLLPYFVDIFFPFGDKEKLFEYRTFAAYYIFTMLLIYLLDVNKLKHFIRINRNVIISLFLLFVYFGYLSYDRGTGFNYFAYLRTNLAPIFTFFYLSIISPTREKIFKFIIITTIIQILIGLTQSFTGFGDLSFNREGEGVVSFLTGGFTGNNLYADFLSFIALILLVEFKFSHQFFLRKYVPLIVIISGYLIFISGIRLSLGTFILGILIHFYISYKKVRKYIFIPFFIGLVLLFFGSYIDPSENVVHDWHVTNNSERQSGLIGIFSGWEYLQYSTIAFSWFLISEFFYNNIFFGSGLYYTSSGYGGIISQSTSNATDVTLALFLTEFGIIGLALLFFHFKTVFYDYSKKIFTKKVLLPIFILVLMTITDSGLFDNVIMSYFYLYLFIHKPFEL
jgi:hypothetical protein